MYQNVKVFRLTNSDTIVGNLIDESDLDEYHHIENPRTLGLQQVTDPKTGQIAGIRPEFPPIGVPVAGVVEQFNGTLHLRKSLCVYPPLQPGKQVINAYNHEFSKIQVVDASAMPRR